MYAMHPYTKAVKKPVKNIITKKIDPKPNMNDIISFFDLVLRLKATNNGIIGKMQGDSIEITPVKKETKGRISI